jgi:hypothetical protein
MLVLYKDFESVHGEVLGPDVSCLKVILMIDCYMIIISIQVVESIVFKMRKVSELLFEAYFELGMNL